MKSPKAASTRHQLPLGIAGFEPASAEVGTLAYATDTDKVRVKTSSGWQDLGGGGGGSVSTVAGDDGVTVANPTGPTVTVGLDHAGASVGDVFTWDGSAYGPAAPAAGGVTSFNARTGAVTPQSGDYTPALVGLGNVTDDAQLKRAAGDFSTFPSKATPTASDVLLIEDAAAAGAKKAITIGDLPSSGGGALGYFSVYKPPASPDADNTEFDGTTLQAGMRMWDLTTKAQITNIATTLQTLGTFPGGTPPTSAWQQGVRESCLSVQVKNANGVFVSKQLATPLHRGSSSGQDAYVAETRMFMWLKDIGLRSGSAGGCVYQFGLAADNGSGDPDWNNRLLWVVYNYMDSAGNWETLIRCLSIVSGATGGALWNHDIIGTNPAGGNYASNSYGRRIENERFGFYMGPNATFGYFGGQHTQIAGDGGSGGITALNGDGAHVYWGFQYAAEDPIVRFDIDYFRCYRGTDPNTPLIP